VKENFHTKAAHERRGNGNKRVPDKEGVKLRVPVSSKESWAGRTCLGEVGDQNDGVTPRSRRGKREALRNYLVMSHIRGEKET